MQHRESVLSVSNFLQNDEMIGMNGRTTYNSPNSRARATASVRRLTLSLP